MSTARGGAITFVSSMGPRAMRAAAPCDAARGDRTRRVAPGNERGDRLLYAFQQMSLTLGIAISAAMLAGPMAMAHHPQASSSDFSVAFLCVSTLSLFAHRLADPGGTRGSSGTQRVRDQPTRPRLAASE